MQAGFLDTYEHQTLNKRISLNTIMRLLMMLLMSCCGLADRIKFTVLIEVATQDIY